VKGLLVLCACGLLCACGSQGYVHSDVFPGLARELGARGVDQALDQEGCGPGGSYDATVETYQTETEVGLTRTGVRYRVDLDC